MCLHCCKTSAMYSTLGLNGDGHQKKPFLLMTLISYIKVYCVYFRGYTKPNNTEVPLCL